MMPLAQITIVANISIFLKEDHRTDESAPGRKIRTLMTIVRPVSCGKSSLEQSVYCLACQTQISWRSPDFLREHLPPISLRLPDV